MRGADLESYRSYQASGVPWLHHVPTHWEVCRIKVEDLSNHKVCRREP